MSDLRENNNLEGWITVQQLADLKNRCRTAVYYWLRNDLAPKHKVVLGRTVFEEEAAKAFTPPKTGPKK